MKEIIVPISAFASCMGYCQYRIINEFQLGLEAVQTLAQKKGEEVHDKLEAEDLLVPRQKATERELLDPGVDLDIPRETLRVAIFRENGKRFAYVGRLDHVMRVGGNVYVIDDKTMRFPKPIYPNTKLQLASYCEGFRINYSDTIAFDKLMFRVVQRDTAGKIMTEVEGEYTDGAKAELMDNFNTFEEIFNGVIPPTHHGSLAKCKACSFECKWRLG